MRPSPSWRRRHARPALARPAVSCEKPAIVADHSAEKRARTVTVLTVVVVQLLEPTEYPCETDLVRPSQQALGIIYALGHGEIDVFRRRHAHEHGVDRFIDQHGEHALENEIGRVRPGVGRGGGRPGMIAVVPTPVFFPEKPPLDEPLLRE